MMATSSDGRNWSMPEVIFPQWNNYKDPRHPIRSQLHQRMGFSSVRLKSHRLS